MTILSEATGTGPEAPVPSTRNRTIYSEQWTVDWPDYNRSHDTHPTSIDKKVVPTRPGEEEHGVTTNIRAMSKAEHKTIGSIAIGKKAGMCIMDKSLNVITTVTGGKVGKDSVHT